MRHMVAAAAWDGLPALDPGLDGAGATSSQDPAYGEFHRCLVQRQVAAWAPQRPTRVLDLSGRPLVAGQLSAAGHLVVQVRDPGRAASTARPAAVGHLPAVVAAQGCLSYLREASLGAVLAESAALPLAVRTAAQLAGVRQVLRPGGSLLLVVDALVLGLARLAGRQDWGALADVPRGGPLVLTGDDGRATRYFRAAELRGLLVAAGFEVDWVRPRTVLTPSAVGKAVQQGVALEALLQTEQQLAEQQDADSGGLQLVACARRPTGTR